MWLLLQLPLEEREDGESSMRDNFWLTKEEDEY
jgi:hypothetical protein